MSLLEVVKNEDDPEVLKAYMVYMGSKISELETENKKLRAKQAKENQQFLKIDDELLTLKKRIFGKSSEKRRSSSRKRDKPKKDLSLQTQSLACA